MNSDLKELHGRDPHTVLGLEQGASKQDVTKAFRRIAAHGAHPDVGGDERTFRQLARARDILVDSRRLADYDAARRSNGFAPVGSPSHPRSEPAAAARAHGRAADPRTQSADSAQSTRAEAGQAAAGWTATGPAAGQAATGRTAASSGDLHPLLIIAFVLALAGPLLWPLAVVTGLVALWRMGRSAQR